MVAGAGVVPSRAVAQAGAAPKRGTAYLWALWWKGARLGLLGDPQEVIGAEGQKEMRLEGGQGLPLRILSAQQNKTKSLCFLA